MRGYVPGYELTPSPSLTHALALLENEPGIWRPFAGGTDLMVLLEADQLSHQKFLDISRIPELRGIYSSSDGISIGALATYSEMAENELLFREFPLLRQAALETGAIAIQNRGTLGGNIANASPAADTPPALLVYDAQICLISTQGKRILPYSTFHTQYKKTLLRPSELIHSVLLKPLPKETRTYYRKVGARRAQAISKVCLAGALRLAPDTQTVVSLRLGIGSVGPIPLRLREVENSLIGKTLTPENVTAARAVLEKEIKPLDDIRSTADYRLHVAGNLLEEFLLKK